MRKLMHTSLKVLLIMLLGLKVGCAKTVIKDYCLKDRYIVSHENDTWQTKQDILEHNLRLEKHCK